MLSVAHNFPTPNHARMQCDYNLLNNSNSPTFCTLQIFPATYYYNFLLYNTIIIMCYISIIDQLTIACHILTIIIILIEIIINCSCLF